MKKQRKLEQLGKRAAEEQPAPKQAKRARGSADAVIDEAGAALCPVVDIHDSIADAAGSHAPSRRNGGPLVVFFRAARS